MKTCLRLIWVSITLLALSQVASSQILPNGGIGGPGNSIYEPAAFQPTRGDLQLGLPGRIWIGSNYADEGLGYEGPYVTIGAKTRLFTDRFDGRWLFEGRGHLATEEGQFFGNFGLERVISIDSMGADVSLSGWVDYDADEQGTFGHSFTQVGISGAIKTRKWDLLGNGYFPVGTTDFLQTGPAGSECFYHNFIALSPGQDSALTGFDTTLRMRPQMLGIVNGTLDIGAYGYGSDLVEYFGGGRVRAGVQLLEGLILSAEVNQDDRFDTTGVLNLTWAYGVNARGSEYAGLGRDLESTVRNDHIVRFQRDIVLAINPDTGAPYNVFHVDNTADPGFADGTAETPFDRLADAEAAAGTNDIIFVREGDGTTNKQDQGIVLQDGQRLLGDGVQHIIPIQGGQNFILCNDLDGNRPVITNLNGNAVTLADGNTVRGFVIDGSAGGMVNGIFGDGVGLGASVNGGIIEDNMISGAILNGVFVNDLIGDWNVARNDTSNNGFDGIFFQNACDPTSVFNFEDNIANTNGRDGIHMENYDAESITFLRNTTNQNGRDGVRLVNFKNGSGNGLNLDLLAHTATGNVSAGVNIDGGDGALRAINSNITGNAGAGFRLANWTNTDPSTSVFIGPGVGGVSNFSNNGAGVGIDIELNAGTQNLLITETTSDNNGFGIRLTTRGLATTLNADILDNFSFSNNLIDGIRVVAESGSIQNLNIGQTAGAFPTTLAANGNALSGINLLSGVAAGGATSVIEANIFNVVMNNNGTGLRANANTDGQITLLGQDLTLNTNGSGIDLVSNNNTNALTTYSFQRVNMDNNAGDGFTITAGNASLTDVFISDAVLTNTNSDYNPGGGAPQAGPNFTNAQAVFGQGIGVNVTTGGTALTRVVVQDSSMSNFSFGAVDLIATGGSTLLARVAGNNMQFNGFGAGDQPAPGTLNSILPFDNGIDINASGTATINYEMTTNIINNSFEFGVNQIATGGSSINGLWIGNDLSGNDIADDATTLGPENNGIDFNVQNIGLGANTCLAMSSNLFNPQVFNNTGLAGNFLLELDGVSNGFGFDFPDVGTPVTPTPFGTVCQPAIEASKLAFEAAGFPPLIP